MHSLITFVYQNFQSSQRVMLSKYGYLLANCPFVFLHRVLFHRSAGIAAVVATCIRSKSSSPSLLHLLFVSIRQEFCTFKFLACLQLFKFRHILHKVGHESELKGRPFQPQKVAFLLYNDVHILVFLRLL
jgi:hypothetical protein